MITSDIFIRCIITGAPMTKKHKEPNFPSCSESGPCPPAWAHWCVGCWGGHQRWGTSPRTSCGGFQSCPRWGTENPAVVLVPLWTPAQSSLYTSPCATCQRMRQRYPGNLEEALVGWKMPWKKQHLRQLQRISQGMLKGSSSCRGCRGTAVRK